MIKHDYRQLYRQLKLDLILESHTNELYPLYEWFSGLWANMKVVSLDGVHLYYIESPEKWLFHKEVTHTLLWFNMQTYGKDFTDKLNGMDYDINKLTVMCLLITMEISSDSIFEEIQSNKISNVYGSNNVMYNKSLK